MIDWDKVGILFLILIVVAVVVWKLSKFVNTKEKYNKKKGSKRNPYLVELNLEKEDSKEILQKLEDAGRPIFELSVMMERYPYAFALLAEDYPDPRKWDALFDTRKFSITASLRMFFAKHGYTYTKKETLNYDKRFEAIRVIEYKVLVTRKHEKGFQEPVYKASGNPFEIMPHSIEVLFDFINTECVNGRIEPVEYHVPLSERECATCLSLKRHNPQRHEICPTCGGIISN